METQVPFRGRFVEIGSNFQKGLKIPTTWGYTQGDLTVSHMSHRRIREQFSNSRTVTTCLCTFIVIIIISSSSESHHDIVALW